MQFEEGAGVPENGVLRMETLRMEFLNVMEQHLCRAWYYAGLWQLHLQLIMVSETMVRRGRDYGSLLKIHMHLLRQHQATMARRPDRTWPDSLMIPNSQPAGALTVETETDDRKLP